MPNKARFITAESSIKSFFQHEAKKVYSNSELVEVFDANRILWNLPVSMTPKGFVDQLMKKRIVELIEIVFESYVDKKHRYTVGGYSVFELASSLVKKSYLSHYSAVYLNGLTNQVPKTIYITFEQSQKRNVIRSLEQNALDSAFTKPQRKTEAIAKHENYSLVMLNGKFSNRAGITAIDRIPVTGVERTLIDIMVRPSYAGGVTAVLDAYKKAKGQVSLNKLVAMLDKLDYIYPYHQALGFYLELAGYTGKKLDELRRREKPLRFYLTYNMQEKDYSEEWKLYFPKGIQGTRIFPIQRRD